MMATHSTICPKVLIFSLVLLSITLRITAEEKRWSRQISNAGFLNDWIPVQPQPQLQQRQNGGRVLNFGPPFPQVQNEYNQQPPPVASNTNLGEPFLNRQIFLQQMHPPNLPILPQNQQQLHVTNLQSTPFRLHDMQLNTGPQQFILQHQHPQPELQTTQQFRYPQFNSPQSKPEFIRNVEANLQAPQPQQLIQSESPQLKPSGLNNVLENQQPTLEMQAIPPQEEVQLLYVPLDTLYQQQQDKLQNTRYNILPSPVNPLHINNFYTHQQKFPATTVAPTSTPFKITTSPAKLRTTTPKPVHRFSFNTVTEGPKPKSHQPPLAMFMKNSLSIANSPSVKDVLAHLIFSRSIDVIDSVGGSTPNIFIGPYGLNTPDGYSKFELPYLSSLEQTRTDRQITTLPFFVAPLSYRAPKGFAKIPLPSPHVGSVVVNSPNTIPDVNSYDDKSFFSDVKLHQQTPSTKRPPQYFSYSTPAPERTRTTSRFRFGSEVSKPTYHQNEPEVISTTPSSLNSFNTFKSTPAYKSQTDNLFQHSVASESDEQNFNHFGNKYHTTGSYATTSSPKQIQSQQTAQPNEDYRLKDEGPSKFSFTNSQPVNTTAFTFKNEEPQNVFNTFFTQTPTASYFNTPEPIVTTKQSDVTNFDEPQRYSPYISSTQAPTSTAATASVAPHRDDEDSYRNDDIEKMKSYFREQEAFKVRNPIAISTPAAYYESSSAGTLATEKGYNDFSTIPSKLTFFNKEPKQHAQNVATTPRTTVTYYTASSSADTSAEQDIPQRLKGHSVHQFRFVNSVLNNDDNKDETQIPTTPKTEEKFVHHEPLQYNEVYNTSPRFETTRAPYRERQTISPFDENTATYNIPSELSPIGSNLPGLINSLMEKEGNTTPFVTIPTTSPVSVTTRRSSVSRTRTRPPTTPRTHQIDDNSAPEITTRRPTRGRRPINYGNRTTTLRTTTPRNISRVRYNPNADERNNNRASTRTRTRVGSRPTKEEENIDYQRDVLKQNYPVLSKNSTKSIDTNNDLPNRAYSYSRETTVSPFEQVKIEENVKVSYSEKESTGPEKYFGIKEDGGRIQNQLLHKEPETPQFVSTTTYASVQNDENQEEITEVLKSRKPSFIRRVPTSTVRSVTTTRYTTQAEYDQVRPKERNSVRQKNWQETSSAAPRIAKPRLRGKRPIATTTVNPTTEVNTDQPYQINSFNKDFYKESPYSKKTANDTKGSSEKRKNQFRFSLNAEESQWSTKFNSNSFQPLSSSDKTKMGNDLPEVEIVTASPMSDAEKETYSFNVQANFFDFNKNKDNESTSTPQPEVNNFEAETIYDNELSKINSNRNAAADENSVQNSGTQYVEHKSKAGTTDQEPEPKSEKKSRRRGVWKRVRVRPVDSFETAESQNIGKQLYNTILSDSVKEFGERNTKKPIGTRIISSPSAYAYEETISFSDEGDTRDQIADIESEVQTILPIQTTEATKNDDFDVTTFYNESIETSDITTDPIENDERELEATSTVNYNDSDDLTTTNMPFFSSDVIDLESLEKSTEKTKTNLPSADDQSAKMNVSDQITEPTSIMDEVKQKLTELFAFEDDDVVVSTTERVFKINRNFKRPKSPLPLYTSIDGNPLVNDISSNQNDHEKSVKSSPATMKLEPVPVLKTILRPITESSSSSFHKDLMDSVIYATSTSTEISHETEICYRGRCVKTQKKP